MGNSVITRVAYFINSRDAAIMQTVKQVTKKAVFFFFLCFIYSTVIPAGYINKVKPDKKKRERVSTEAT